MKDFHVAGGLCAFMLAVPAALADRPAPTEKPGDSQPLTSDPPVPFPQGTAQVPIPAPDEFPEPVGLPSQAWADSIRLFPDEGLPLGRFRRLTEEDFREVAEELGSFQQPGKPLINFDLTMYRKFAPRHGVSLSQARKKSPVIFSRPDTRKYGSYQAAQYARLEGARAIDEASALESAFWGMFQIGGFNWKLCGCESVEEFVDRMSRSERDQLELFARLITNCGMLESLQKKQWLRFALKYNGPRAKSRGYHKRMASAYSRYKEAEK